MKNLLMLVLTLCAITANAQLLAGNSTYTNKESVLEEIQKTDRLERFHLENIPESLRKDKAVVLAAVKQNAANLEFVDNSLKNDIKIIIAAVRTRKKGNNIFSDHHPDGSDVLEHASSELKNNKAFILMLMKETPFAIKYASKNLKADKDFILAAVKKDPMALGFAANTLTKNKEVVLAAVKLDGNALLYADSSLKKDKEVVVAAMKQNIYSLRYADSSFKTNKDIREMQKNIYYKNNRPWWKFWK